MNHIGTRIKSRREELGMVQEELAKKLGYKSKSTINKIELGINDVTQSKVVEYAKALDTSVAYLMGWEDEDRTTDILVEVTENKDLQILVERAMKMSNNNLEQLLKYSEFLSSSNEKEND